MSDVETDETSLTVRRRLDAPRARVFRAFTDPAELSEWYSHGQLSWEVHRLEPEPGGTLSLTMTDGNDRFEVEGEYVEVVEGERIVHSWYVGRVTIDFEDAGDATEVVVTHDDLPAGESTEQLLAVWQGALDGLEALVDG